jgi:hypothetical protein
MSRGPGRWQRALLECLEQSEIVNVGAVWKQLDRPATRAEEVAGRRAARELVRQGRARAIYLMLPTVNDGRRHPQLVLTRPDSTIRGDYFNPDRHPGWMEWVDGARRQS